MKTTALLAFLLIAPGSALAQGARLQLDSLDRLASQATEVVNIAFDAGTLQFAGSFLNGSDQATVKQMLSQLKGIYVRSYEFDRDTGFASELEAVRKQLTAPGWTRIIAADSKRDRELVEIYSWREGDKSGGLAIVVAEAMELTIVNIVGPIDLSKLGALQGQFGIPRIPSVEPAPAGRD